MFGVQHLTERDGLGIVLVAAGEGERQPPARAAGRAARRRCNRRPCLRLPSTRTWLAGSSGPSAGSAPRRRRDSAAAAADAAALMLISMGHGCSDPRLIRPKPPTPGNCNGPKISALAHPLHSSDHVGLGYFSADLIGVSASGSP